MNIEEIKELLTTIGLLVPKLTEAKDTLSRIVDTVENPKTAIQQLKEKGIKVKAGTTEKQAQELLAILDDTKVDEVKPSEQTNAQTTDNAQTQTNAQSADNAQTQSTDNAQTQTTAQSTDNAQTQSTAQTEPQVEIIKPKSVATKAKTIDIATLQRELSNSRNAVQSNKN